MLLEYIRLKNFRQFKDEQKIVFSTDKEKNVTVILGKNTGGKTTLVQSFIWCLYSDITFNDKVLLNKEKYLSLKDRPTGVTESVEVTIKLSHDNNTYLITRTMDYTINSSRQITAAQKFIIKYLNSNMAWVPLDAHEREDAIKKILPKELSNYFFFWGERIENLGQKSNVTEAVKDFMGLSQVENAERHLRKAITKFDTSSIDANDYNIAVCVDEINKISDEIEKKKMELNEAEENTKYYLDKYQELQGVLSSNPDSSSLKKEIDSLIITKNSLKKRLIESKELLHKKFNNNNYIYFSNKISKKAVSLIDKMPEEELGYAYQDNKSLKEILDHGICLCGTKLEVGTEPYLKFMEVYKKIAPNSIKSRCDQYKIAVETNNKLLKNYASDFRNEFAHMYDHEKDIDDINEKIKDKNDMFKNMPDMSSVKKEADSKFKEYSDKKILKGKLESDINNLEIRLKSKVEEKDRLLEKEDKYNKTLLYKRYAEAVLESIKTDFGVRRENINKRINTLVNQYFQQMYHGERELIINENFNIELLSNVNGKKEKTDLSAGLETVKNFAFVAGLVEMAIEKVGDDDELSHSEPYPLVLDAPFSQVDEVHVPNICKLISQVAEQTIIVVMEKDWAYAKEIMKDKVGKYYILEKQSEVYTQVVSSESEEA